MLLNFLACHLRPKKVIGLLYPLACYLTKKEKNPAKWSVGFFVIAEKR